MLLTVFTKTSVKPSGHSCTKCFNGLRHWPFKAVQNDRSWGGKEKRVTGLSSLNIFHKGATFPEAPCSDFQKNMPPLLMAIFASFLSVSLCVYAYIIYMCIFVHCAHKMLNRQTKWQMHVLKHIYTSTLKIRLLVTVNVYYTALLPGPGTGCVNNAWLAEFLEGVAGLFSGRWLAVAHQTHSCLCSRAPWSAS